MAKNEHYKTQPRVPAGNPKGGQFAKIERVRVLYDSDYYTHYEEHGRIVRANSAYKSKKKPYIVGSTSDVTKRQWSQWYGCIGQLERGIYFTKTQLGYLLPVENKIFVTSGTYSDPVLVEIWEFKDEIEALEYNAIMENYYG